MNPYEVLLYTNSIVYIRHTFGNRCRKIAKIVPLQNVIAQKLLEIAFLIIRRDQPILQPTAYRVLLRSIEFNDVIMGHPSEKHNIIQR